MSRSRKDGRGGHAKRGAIYTHPEISNGKLYGRAHVDYPGNVNSPSWWKRRASKRRRKDSKAVLGEHLNVHEDMYREYVEELKKEFLIMLGLEEPVYDPDPAGSDYDPEDWRDDYGSDDSPDPYYYDWDYGYGYDYDY